MKLRINRLGLSEELEELVYSVVAKEIADRQIVPGVWTKSFAEADGDEKRALALYIRHRTPQVAQDIVAAIEAEKQRQTEQEERVRIERERQRQLSERMQAEQARQQEQRENEERERLALTQAEQARQQEQRELEDQQRLADDQRRRTNPVRVNCPHCCATLLAFPRTFGTTVRCKACKKSMRIANPYK